MQRGSMRTLAAVAGEPQIVNRMARMRLAIPTAQWHAGKGATAFAMPMSSSSSSLGRLGQSDHFPRDAPASVRQVATAYSSSRSAYSVDCSTPPAFKW